LPPPSAVERVTWKDHFNGADEQFVTEKFDEMFLSDEHGKPYISTFLSDEELKSPEEVQAVLDHFVQIMGGEEFFHGCIGYLQSLIYDIHPRFIYAKGEPSAKTAYETAKEIIVKEDEGLIEFGETLLRVNKLWELINGRYVLQYGEYFPKEQIDMVLYDERLVGIINSLRSGGVSEKAIRELTTLGPQKFSAGVMNALFEFTF
jgi:proline dehydrogenase